MATTSPTSKGPLRIEKVRWMGVESVLPPSVRAFPTASPEFTTMNNFPDGLSADALRHCVDSLIGDAGCAVAICDRRGHIHFMNKAAIDCFENGSIDSLSGSTLHDLLPTPTAEIRLELIRRALEDGTTQSHVGLTAMNGMWRKLCVRALERTNGGERALLVCAPLAQVVTMNDLVGPEQAFCQVAVDLGPFAKLTEREMQVLRLIGLGLSTNDIADNLHRSKKTIEWHRVSLGSKLNVSNRVELARLALSSGLTWFDDDAITHIWRTADRNGHPPRDDE